MTVPGPPLVPTPHIGHGLIGMRERVAAHHGQLRAVQRPEGGFEVVATIPTGDEP